uniref:Uncharacterized protein n=1 Tax=Cyprinus carpio TaxID=7962 RepID=A0A8C2HH96_CYPCA
MLFQYFITAVPTKLHTSGVSVNMHHFSVTEQVDSRVFLLHRLIGYFVDIICCRFRLGADQSKEVSYY